MVQISSMIIGILIVGGLVATVGIYYADVASRNGATFDQTNVAQYSRLGEIQEQMVEINQTMSRMNQGGVTDYISGFLKGGYQTMQVTQKSFGTLTGMSGKASSDIVALVPGASPILLSIVAILFVVFVFAILKYLIGQDV
jgi:hypothetical protein